MERVLIVGCPGAGKSTASRALAAQTGLPLIHLDYHYWHAGWVPTAKEAWREKILVLAARPRWIMDGNYGGSLEDRARRADTLIHLDFPTWLCLWRVIRRTIGNLGRERVGELVPGCPERLSGDFLRFVLFYRRRQRARDLARMSAFDGQRFTFHRPSELESFLKARLVRGRTA